jgi:MOSC domain-containing protein YiiM
MKLLSVNVGLPREIEWKGKVVRTPIFKAPVPGRIRVAKLNVEGDQQSDLTVHGGIEGCLRLSFGALPILAQGTSWHGPSVGSFR